MLKGLTDVAMVAKVVRLTAVDAVLQSDGVCQVAACIRLRMCQGIDKLPLVGW